MNILFLTKVDDWSTEKWHGDFLMTNIFFSLHYIMRDFIIHCAWSFRWVSVSCNYCNYCSSYVSSVQSELNSYGCTTKVVQRIQQRRQAGVRDSRARVPILSSCPSLPLRIQSTILYGTEIYRRYIRVRALRYRSTTAQEIERWMWHRVKYNRREREGRPYHLLRILFNADSTSERTVGRIWDTIHL